MRVALSGTSSRCFTVSPALISIFGVVLAGCGCCFCLVFVWFVFVFCLVALFGLLPPRVRSLYLLSCVRIVCNLERPSELSWRARHGRKKKMICSCNHSTMAPTSLTACICDCSNKWLQYKHKQRCLSND